VLHAIAAVWLPGFAVRARPLPPPDPLIVTFAAGPPKANTSAAVIESRPDPPARTMSDDARLARAAALPRPERARPAGDALPPAGKPAPEAARTPAVAAAVQEPAAAAEPSPVHPEAVGAVVARSSGGEADPAVEPARFNVAYLNNPPPDYPPVARRMRVEGTVVLRALVDTTGRAEELLVEQTSGAPLLDEAALNAVRKWRFVPARRGPEPIARWVEVPVRFRLND
jgi:protein TonB